MMKTSHIAVFSDSMRAMTPTAIHNRFARRIPEMF
jgi:hypothetical protein